VGFCLGVLLAAAAAGQVVGPPFIAPPNPVQAAPKLQIRVNRVQPPNQVEESQILIFAEKQMKEGPWYYLRGKSSVQTNTFLLKADDIDYNEDTGEVDARGNVYLLHFAGGEELYCDHAVYNMNDETGKFWEVHGQAPTRIIARPHVLTSSNPFYYEGDWAERVKEKYVLHDGFITNCKMPQPWWLVRAPVFDIIPYDRAISHNSVFWFRRVGPFRRIPLFFTPYYYKSLQKLPRQSGFLTPNIGNSSIRGRMIGAGYYWAINRSYDLGYRGQYFTNGAFAHNLGFRAKPRVGTEVSAFLFGVQDFEPKSATAVSGYVISAELKSQLGDGFYARGELNYLSSFAFRQSFTQSYTEGIGSEVHSVGFLAKDWSSYDLDFVAQRSQIFSFVTAPGANTSTRQYALIHKLPEVDFDSRDQQLWPGIPIWVSWQMSGGLLSRTEPVPATQSYLRTDNFVDREDLYPEVTTVLRLGDFALVPSFAVRETHYGESRDQLNFVSQDISRSAHEVNVKFVVPSLARIYKAPKGLGDEVKHVIETGADYHYVGGVNNFNSIVRFDVLDLFSNTDEVEYWITNRLYSKRKDAVQEIFSWDLRQERYFNQTFGGAVSNWCGQPSCRDMVLSEIELTPYAFIDGPRPYSPIVSTLRVMPRPGIGVEWRADYDPLRHNLVASSATVDLHYGKYGFAVGHNSLKAVPTLTPDVNQLQAQFTIGNENRRGWNFGVQGNYDYRLQRLQFLSSQATYNTDCCGFSFQYRRLAFGILNENLFLAAFSIANVGSFGTLKKQERMF
jgi:LPS-assembly protein